jgi:hypothetical protein
LNSQIPNQVELPLRTATEIVVQGIRIRFGRSLVTLAGVLLGITFLMSTVTTFYVKEGVRGEDQLRAEARRMMNFLTAEIGPVRDRTVAVAAFGEVPDAEIRLLRQIARGGASAVLWTGPAPTPSSIASLPVVKQQTLREAMPESRVLLLLGSEPPSGEVVETLQSVGASIPLAFTGEVAPALHGASIRTIPLSVKLSEEEMARRETERQAARVRTLWIVAIALLVTIMGIANAMLMSVTERFREIGTMKCLGATTRFIRRIFLIESSLIGAAGGLAGALLGVILSLLFHGFVYGFGTVLGSVDSLALLGALGISTVLGILLSVVAALYPAAVASSMVPADALRSNV